MEDSNLDKILKKYISVWIWSIIFGAAYSLTSNIFLTKSFDKWGPLSILFILIYTYLVIFLLLSWINLYRYLVRFILPKFFLLKNELDENETKLTNNFLRRSFMFLIIAAFLRILIPLVESFLYFI